MEKRRIRSFVMRAGRMTDGQTKALESHWPLYGLEPSDALSSSDRPRVVELGFGMGGSLLEQCVAEPEKDFVGIEVHLPGVGRLLAGAAEAGVNNLKVYKHDGVEVLRDCIPDASVDRFQLYFPDPWHKKRHHKRRIVQPEFAAQVRAKLKPGGLFHLATDWQPYAEYMLEVMQQAPGFENTGTDYVEKPEWRPVTKFQKRGERLGHGVWDLVYRAV